MSFWKLLFFLISIKKGVKNSKACLNGLNISGKDLNKKCGFGDQGIAFQEGSLVNSPK